MPPPPLIARLAERLGLSRRELVGWALYDWANSAMLTTVVAAVFPVFFTSFAADGLAPGRALQLFGWTTTACMLFAAVLSPVLGALADVTAAKKRFLAAFLVLGAAGCAAMFFIERGQWVFAAGCFFVANVGATASFVFYDSLLPHIARPDELDRVSTAGYALGYVGGGLVLSLNLAAIQHPEWFGLPAGEGLSDAARTLPARLSFLSVAVWWGLFSIPLFRWVREPPRAFESDERASDRPLRTALTRLGETFGQLRRYRQALLFLLAFIAFNDGIGTIIRMAAVFGAERGIDQRHLIGAIVLVQFVGIPCSFAFGAIAARVGAKRAILATIVVYLATTLVAARMETARDFYLLATLVALVQGGSQALSRSLFASLIPKHKSAEFFGLFSVFEKFAGVLGPLALTLAASWTGASSYGLIPVAGFFVVGGALLVCVDVEAGQRAARAAEAELAS